MLLQWVSVIVTVALILSYFPVVDGLPSPNSQPSYVSSPSLDSSTADGTYVGDSKANDNLISYRLVITVSKQRILSADFRLLYDGFDWSPGAAAYIEEWLIDPQRHAIFLANVATYDADAAAAIAYNSQLVGLSNPNQLPAPSPGSNLTSVYDGLLNAWNKLMELKLLLVEHVNVTTLGDNSGAMHTWNEYIPHCVQQDLSRKVPLVLSLHGSGNTIVMAEGLLFPFVGGDPDNCFITLIPDDSAQPAGIGNWNVAPTANSTALSDVEFLLALIKHEQETKAIDETRIYLSGISNGAAMSTYLSMLYPKLFAGVAALAGAVGCTGGSYNAPFVTAAEAVLAKGTPLLPVIAGAGDEDNFNFLTPLRGQGNYTTAAPCYRNQMNWWKTYNGISQMTWNPNYFFGQNLEENDEYEAYGFDIETGVLSAPSGSTTAYPLLKFYTVLDMFHLDPNPSVAVLSWNFLKHFSRLADGTLLHNGLHFL